MHALVFLVFQTEVGGDDGKQQFVLKTPKVRSFKHYCVLINRTFET